MYQADLDCQDAILKLTAEERTHQRLRERRGMETVDADECRGNNYAPKSFGRFLTVTQHPNKSLRIINTQYRLWIGTRWEGSRTYYGL